MSERRDEFFTIVFRGDIRKLGFNPLTAETIYGEPVGAAVGDCLSELWDLKDGTNTADADEDELASRP
jgi:hypothetical protein